MTAQKFTNIEKHSLDSPLHCIVTTSHISEMYQRFESGLCDQTTCNAVALSLSQLLGHPVRVFRRHGRALLELPHRRITELPHRVCQWLEKVDRGLYPEPFRFEFPDSISKT